MNARHAPADVFFYCASEKPYDRPAGGSRFSVKCGIVFDGVRPAVPIVAIGLDDETVVGHNEVWLPSAEHRFVHFKFEPSPREFFANSVFNRRHPRWKMLPEPSGADSVSSALSYRSTHFSEPIQLSEALRGPHARTSLDAGDHLRARFSVRPRINSSAVSTTEDLAFNAAGSLAYSGSALAAQEAETHAGEAVCRTAFKRAEAGPGSPWVPIKKRSFALKAFCVFALLTKHRPRVSWLETFAALHASFFTIEVSAHSRILTRLCEQAA